MIKETKCLGSSSHALQQLTDAVEDQLILGTPPDDTLSPITAQYDDDEPDILQNNVDEPPPPEIEDDDLL